MTKQTVDDELNKGENFLGVSKLKAHKKLLRRNYRLTLALERDDIGKNLAELLRTAAIVEFHAHSGKELVEEGYFSLARQQIKEAIENYRELDDYLEHLNYPAEFKKDFLEKCGGVLNESIDYLNKSMTARLSSTQKSLGEIFYGR